MKHLKNVLAIFSVLLFLFGFWICEYFYYDDITNWRELRDALKNLNMLIIVGLHFTDRTALMKGAFMTLLILVFFDQVDRFLFSTTVFVWSDWILIPAALFAGYKAYRKNGKVLE